MEAIPPVHSPVQTVAAGGGSAGARGRSLVLLLVLELVLLLVLLRCLGQLLDYSRRCSRSRLVVGQAVVDEMAALSA